MYIHRNGARYWIKNNDYHRKNGPAIINNRSIFWVFEGKNHRLDGPAVILFGGKKLWYYQGTEIKCSNQEEFDKLIKLKMLW